MSVSLLPQLKPVDPERYLACLLMPERIREAAAALYLFNAELASVRERIREPTAGEMRLVWWRDAVAGECDGEAKAHPVAAALLDVIESHGLPRAPLMAMAEARSFDLYDDPMPGRVDFEGYAGETAAALIQLTAVLLEPEKAAMIAEACGHAGVLHAISGHLQLLPLTRARGQVFLPQDLMGACGVNRETFLDPEQVPAASRAVEAFCALGEEHLECLRQRWSAVPPVLKPAFLPLANAPGVLRRTTANPEKALLATVAPGPLRRQWSMLRMALTGKILG